MVMLKLRHIKGTEDPNRANLVLDATQRKVMLSNKEVQLCLALIYTRHKMWDRAMPMFGSAVSFILLSSFCVLPGCNTRESRRLFLFFGLRCHRKVSAVA